jgi:hypothetical protein
VFVIFLIGHLDDNDRPRAAPFSGFDLALAIGGGFDSVMAASHPCRGDLAKGSETIFDLWE